MKRKVQLGVNVLIGICFLFFILMLIPSDKESGETVSPSDNWEAEWANPFQVNRNYAAFLPNQSELESDTALMETLEQEKELLEKLCNDELDEDSIVNGEVIALEHLMQFVAMYPNLLEEKNISYAIPTGPNPKEMTLIVYRTGGKNYSLLLSSDDTEKEAKTEKFIANITEVFCAFDTIVKFDCEFVDTYQESGQESSGKKGSYETIFYMMEGLTDGGELDLYTVYSTNCITPYQGKKIGTLKNSYEIAPMSENTTIMTGTPYTSSQKAKEYSYEIKMTYPLYWNYSFEWTGSPRTKMEANLGRQAHEIVWSDSKGIVGGEENGAFSYNSTTIFTLPKDTSLQFYFGQVMFDAPYGKEKDIKTQMDEWLVVIYKQNRRLESRAFDSNRLLCFQEGRNTNSS